MMMMNAMSATMLTLVESTRKPAIADKLARCFRYGVARFISKNM